MFTLKLYRRCAAIEGRAELMSKVVAVDHVRTIQIGRLCSAIEITAFRVGPGGDYDTYYIGKPEEGMDAYGRDDLHLNSESSSWWGWAYLENAQGRTTERYTPDSYGPH